MDVGGIHQFARDGVVLLGHLTGIQGHKVLLASDLRENLGKSDKFAADIMQAVDEYVQKTGLDVPAPERNTVNDFCLPAEGYTESRELDLKAAGITTVIWATGFTCNFKWVHLPVFDEDGYPVQQRGITPSPGLYFLGLHFLHNAKSGLFFGVGDDAAHIASDIVSRLTQ